MSLFPKQKQAHRQTRQYMVTKVEGGGEKSGLQNGQIHIATFKIHSQPGPSVRHRSCRVSCKSLSHVRLLATPWTVAHQAPISMGFSRQECWRGLPCPSPGHLPDPGIEPRSLALQADALTSRPPGKPIAQEIILKSFNSI